MFPETSGKFPAIVIETIHLPSDKFLILDLDTNLAISIPQKTAVVDVCRAADDQLVVNNAELGVDVDQLGHRGACIMHIVTDSITSG